MLRYILSLLCLTLFFSCSNDEDLYNENPESFPSYQKEEYDSFRDRLLSYSSLNCYKVIFATDLHFANLETNYCTDILWIGINNMFKAVYRLTHEFSLNMCVLGGDYMQLPLPNKGQTKEMGIKNLEQLNTWMEFSNCPIFPIIGNHELDFSGTGEGFGLTYDEFYNYCQKQFVEKNVVKRINAYNQLFIRDDIDGSVRHIFINTGQDDYSNVKEDLKNVLDSTPEDYSVIIYNHFTGWPFDEGRLDLYPNVKECLDIVEASGVDFIAWIGGHNHADMCYTYHNMVVISCLQSGFWTSNASQDGITYMHNERSANESAFSVFVIRKDLGKIYVVRYGLGKDREINYNAKSGEIGLVKR